MGFSKKQKNNSLKPREIPTSNIQPKPLSKEDKRRITEALTKMGFKPEDVHSMSQTTKTDWRKELEATTMKDR